MASTSTNVKIVVGARLPADVEGVFVFLPEGGKPDDAAGALLTPELRASISKLLDAKAATGKARDIAGDLVHARKRIVRLGVVGLGKPEKLTPYVVAECAAGIARHAKRERIARIAVVLPEVKGIGVSEIAARVTQGLLLAGFRYAEYKGTARTDNSESSATPEPKELGVVLVTRGNVAAAVGEARIVADAQNFARTVAHRPGNDINPVSLARVVQGAAKSAGLRCRILDEREMARLNMGGILAVGAGASATPPRMIVLEHRPARAKKTILLVGKAITFDTGGISIKPAEKMGRMVFDKCGGMAVMGALIAAAQLKLPVHVVGILAAAENHISERAYRPGDILRMHNGVTVEVTNTDAEGRLVLGDALAWGIKTYKPAACLDLATLTGGVIVALGKSMAGVMGNDQKLIDSVMACGKAEGEKLWQLPMPEDPSEMLKSDFADIVNSAGRDAAPLQGAAFLSFFVPGETATPWAHLDIAGVADTERELPLYAKGATGWGVWTLVRWLREQ